MPGMMQAKETAHPTQEQQSQEDEVAKATVGDDQIARLEMVQQLVEQTQLVPVFIAFLIIKQNTAGEAENAHDFHQRKTTTRLLGAGLGILPLILGRVRQTHG